MKVSIILPIYNMEQKLARCMDSIFVQEGADLEIIMVDDGSTDASWELCAKYKEFDERVFIVHQQNQGLSGARNTGINNATGDYIWFIDPDDTIPENALMSLANAVDEFPGDIIKGGFNRIKCDQTEKIHRHNWTAGIVDKYGNDHENERFNQLKTDWTFGCVWSGLYRRSFLLNNGIL